MITRPIAVSIRCFVLLIVIESLAPKAMAQRTSNINDYRMEDQGTHKRNNYVLQRARDKEMFGRLDNVGVTYDTGTLDAARNPELPAFIVDYANMIDDVILLDKSVETRTRKRGNIKLEKHNQIIPDPPCSCQSIPDSLVLGHNTFPKRVDIRVCDKNQQDGCAPLYACKEIEFEIAVLKRKPLANDSSPVDKLYIPQNLLTNWFVDFKRISVGCECKRDFSD